MGAVPGKRYSPYSFRISYMASNRKLRKGSAMNKKLIIIAIIAALAGDAEAVWRGNRKWYKSHRAVIHENEMLQMKVNVLVQFINDIAAGNDPEHAVESFVDMAKFINIVD